MRAENTGDDLNKIEADEKDTSSLDFPNQRAKNAESDDSDDQFTDTSPLEALFPLLP